MKKTKSIFYERVDNVFKLRRGFEIQAGANVLLVEDVITTEIGVELKTNIQEFSSKMVLGADGAHSIINKKLGNIKVEKEHYCAGLRQYYKGVTNFHPQNHIELHFYDDVLPGYFWIFPLPNGQANVGLGMLSSEVSKKKVNLKDKKGFDLWKEANVIKQKQNGFTWLDKD